MKLGLALSGGGVKGAAHIGVIQALEEHHIKIDAIRRNEFRKYGNSSLCNGVFARSNIKTI